MGWKRASHRVSKTLGRSSALAVSVYGSWRSRLSRSSVSYRRVRGLQSWPGSTAAHGTDPLEPTVNLKPDAPGGPPRGGRAGVTAPAVMPVLIFMACLPASCVVLPVAASVDVWLRYQESKGRARAPIAQGSPGVASRQKRLQGVDEAGGCGRGHPRHPRPQGS